MKIDNKKLFKLIVLLVSSLLIGFVSAGTYSELFMHGTPIQIGSAEVTFTTGTNTTTMGGSDAINTQGTEVTFDTIPPIAPSETVTYEQAVNITNNSGATKTLNMSLFSITGNFSANFEYLNVTVFNGAGSQQGNSVEIVSSVGGTNVTYTGSLTMPNGETWYVRWTIKAKTDATDGHSFDVTLKVKVE